jgi:hypothetical protein
MLTETDSAPETLDTAEILARIRQLEAEIHHERDEVAAWYEHG